MASITYAEFLDQLPAYDDAVDRSPLVDPFCTGSAWIVPAYEAFSEGSTPWVHRFDEGYAVLTVLRTVLGRTVMPFEASWGLAAPFVGSDLAAVAGRFVEVALAHRSRWDAMFLSGLSRGGPDFTAIVRRLGRQWRLGLGQPTVRCIASLQGGEDGFLSRRSPKFRKNLRRAERLAGERLTFDVQRDVTGVTPEEVLESILQVERLSWKGQEGHGIDQGPMRAFYANMLPRLVSQGSLRLTRAFLDGEQVGYVLGGLRGPVYRGLQISFDASHDELSVGNLMQLHTVRALCEEGAAAYDLGTDMPYKRRWAEQLIETVPLVVR